VERLQIRALRAEDAEEIGRIQSAITQTPSEIDFKKVFDDQVKRSGGASFVAELEGKVVGYMISYVLSGGFGIEKSAWIAMLGVEPRLMGRGIGKRLAQEIFRVYRDRGIRNVYTSVRWDSTDLLSFFKTLDFDRSDFINLRKVLE
jgi:ribosomal protein S18 acetylase RimI-like enzyme